MTPPQHTGPVGGEMSEVLRVNPSSQIRAGQPVQVKVRRYVSHTTVATNVASMIIRYDPGGGWHNGELGILIINAKLSYRSSCVSRRKAMHMYCPCTPVFLHFRWNLVFPRFPAPRGGDLTSRTQGPVLYHSATLQALWNNRSNKEGRTAIFALGCATAFATDLYSSPGMREISL